MHYRALNGADCTKYKQERLFVEAEMVRPIVKITNKPLATLIITNMICSEQTKHANPQIYHHSVQENGLHTVV